MYGCFKDFWRGLEFSEKIPGTTGSLSSWKREPQQNSIRKDNDINNERQ